MSSDRFQGRRGHAAASAGTALGLILFLLPLVPGLQAQEAATNSPATLPPNALTLQTCYEEALRNDPAIRTARAAFEEATGQKMILQAIALPQVNAGLLVGQQGPRENTANPSPRNFILATGSVDQALFNAAIPASFRRGRLDLAIAEQQFNRTAINELYELRVAFYNALNSQASMEVEESIQKRLQANLDAQKSQLAVGKVSRREVAQASNQLAAVGPQLSLARGTLRQSQIELARLMGRDLGAATADDPEQGLPHPLGALEAEPISIDIPAETAYALAHRPDLLALRALIAATQEDKNIAEAGYYPKIDFVANLQYIPQTAVKKSGTIVQSGDTVESTQILYGISETWQVIDVGAVRGTADELQANKEGYQIDLKRLEEDVPRNLVQIEAQLRQVATQLEGSEQTVALADENLRQIEAQVANGDLPQLDFLNAQSNLLQARFQRLNALLENNLAIAQLDVITGRYLQFVPTTASGKPQP